MKCRLLWFLVAVVLLAACSSASENTDEASQKLTATKQWQISEILIDDSPIYKDKKHIPHISGIVFDTYMDWVKFNKNGLFEGHFNYKPANVTEKFQWLAYPKQNVIALRDTVNKTGGWNIYPRTVKNESFEMEVHSSAYDPPRMTKVTLRFTVGQDLQSDQ